jgi:hypothetical protein
MLNGEAFDAYLSKHQGVNSSLANQVVRKPGLSLGRKVDFAAASFNAQAPRPKTNYVTSDHAPSTKAINFFPGASHGSTANIIISHLAKIPLGSTQHIQSK